MTDSMGEWSGRQRRRRQLSLLSFTYGPDLDLRLPRSNLWKNKSLASSRQKGNEISFPYFGPGGLGSTYNVPGWPVSMKGSGNKELSEQPEGSRSFGWEGRPYSNGWKAKRSKPNVSILLWILHWKLQSPVSIRESKPAYNILLNEGLVRIQCTSVEHFNRSTDWSSKIKVHISFG